MIGPRVGLVALLVAGGVAFWVLRAPELMPAAAPEQAFVPAASDTPSHAMSAAPAVQPASENEQEARLAFHSRTRAFFAAAPALSADQRASEAQSLAGDVAHYEARGELSAGEALLLKMALVRESTRDPALQAQQLADLKRSYEEQTRQRQAVAAAQRDPMFELYKLRETTIAQQVMAMREIPGGVSRDEYLRRRLQAERELLMDGSAR